MKTWVAVALSACCCAAEAEVAFDRGAKATSRSVADGKAVAVTLETAETTDITLRLTF